MKTKKPFYMIHIDYEEWKIKTYKAVVVLYGEERVRFETGNPITDFKAAQEYVSQFTKQWVNMSSVDNFQMDGGKLY